MHAEPLHSSLRWCPGSDACALRGTSARLHKAGEPCRCHPAQLPLTVLPGDVPGCPPWGFSHIAEHCPAACAELHGPIGAREMEVNTHLALDYLPYASHMNVSVHSSAQGEGRTFPCTSSRPTPNAHPSPQCPQLGWCPQESSRAKICQQGECGHPCSLLVCIYPQTSPLPNK